MRFFFYGMLLDPELRRIVIGREIALTAATLSGWRRLAIADKPYPFIERDAAASVVGVATEPLDAGEVARLRRYEGDGYQLAAVEVREDRGSRIAAEVFVPPEGCFVGVGTWDLGAWQRDHRVAALDRLRDYDWPRR
jgi:hypothetical protein